MVQTPTHRRQAEQTSMEKRKPNRTWTHGRRLHEIDGQMSPNETNRLLRRCRALQNGPEDERDFAVAPKSPSPSCPGSNAINRASPSKNKSPAKFLSPAGAHPSEHCKGAGAPLTDPSAEVQTVEKQALQSPFGRSGKERASKEEK
ncbi:hypothetical protein AC578_5305 [Pseudocercospora eumusae]|nr:hypothetical protein AC578_5305 [Pseudocercospora eumusae]